MKIQVHTTPGCMQCRTLMRKLDKSGVAYDVINLEQHPELVEQLRELGLTQAPIVTTEGFSFTGFRPDKIKELERRYKREKRDA